mgnify:CR=1 FL=1|jgi:hypothetical protein
MNHQLLAPFKQRELLDEAESRRIERLLSAARRCAEICVDACRSSRFARIRAAVLRREPSPAC